jgi:hypothetical protein
VARNTLVEFDVGAAISGDGTYCFGLDSASTDGVAYLSREAGGALPAVEILVERPVGPACGDGAVNQEGEVCDRADDLACPGRCRSDCTCPPPICGDDRVNTPTEECDGADAEACPGACASDCMCDTTAPVAVVEADAAVFEEAPESNFGFDPIVGADASPGERTFFRVRVRNVGHRSVLAVRLRLETDGDQGGSDSGGRLWAVIDCSWDEAALTWNTQPVVDGTILDAKGPVASGDVVDFDVGDVVDGDGTYCFALDTLSSDDVQYAAREALSGRPRLLLVTSGM